MHAVLRALVLTAVDSAGQTTAQSGLIRRDREIRIFGYMYFSFFMHARITPKMANLGVMI